MNIDSSLVAKDAILPKQEGATNATAKALFAPLENEIKGGAAFHRRAGISRRILR